jgi:dTDP-4-dehydrorhamnose reductase
MILIIGGSSYIGKNLFNAFLNRGFPVHGTYYNSPEKRLLYFDLENPNIKDLNIDLKKINRGIICSAISKIDECKRDEKRAYKINVAGTKRIIEQFWSNKITPVFISSDFVFDGKKGNYTEQDKTNPCTVYGSHKKEIEDFLLNSNKDYFITRISKIFGLENDGTILVDWINKLRNKEDIKCATDQIFCPTYIQDLTNAITLGIDLNLRGLYNIASPEKFSRYDLASKLRDKLQLKTGNIDPCSIKNFNFLDNRSLNTSLLSDKFMREVNFTNFQFTKMDDCISKLEDIIQ